MTAASGSKLFEELDVLDDGPPRSAALNMALDETLLGTLRETPLLRLYRWERPAASFGYFERWQAVAALHPHRELVRRWTGGGVVLHGDDLTYSLLVPRTHPLTNLSAGESYRLVHLALGRGLSAVGAGRMSLSGAVGGLSAAPLRECFAQPVQHDLLLDGRKVAGAAQRRTRQGWLHQGSVFAAAFEQWHIEQLADTLPSLFAVRWFPRDLRPAELTTAAHLAAQKYAAEAWSHLR